VLILVNGFNVQAIEKITYSSNWITIILVVLLVVVFLLKITDGSKLKKIFYTITNYSNIEDDDEFGLNLYSNFEFIIFIFSSTVIALMLSTFKFSKNLSEHTFSNFIYVFIGVFSYMVFGKIFQKLIASVFMISRAVSSFLTSKSRSFYSVSFLLYIFFILYQYSSLGYNSILYCTLILFSFRFVFLIVKNKNLIFSKLFYFILYLCAFEIAPLFVLFKLIF
jgi:hypothetical protein